MAYLNEFYAGEQGLAAQIKRIEDQVEAEEARRAKLPALEMPCTPNAKKPFPRRSGFSVLPNPDIDVTHPINAAMIDSPIRTAPLVVEATRGLEVENRDQLTKTVVHR